MYVEIFFIVARGGALRYPTIYDDKNLSIQYNMLAMMGPSPAPITTATPGAPPAQGGFPISQTQMIAIAIVAVAYYQRAQLGRNGLIVAAVIAAALVWNERRQKQSGYCPNCKR
jgi:hypothetical protein